MLNWLLFWPKKEWNPHSNAVLFSAFGLYGANIKLIASNNTANMGIKNKKKVKLVNLIYYKNTKNIH